MPRKPAPPAPSPECNGFCMDMQCPSCWAWLAEATSVEQWLKAAAPAPTRLIIDLDEPTFDVLQREASRYKAQIETVAKVLLQEAAAGIAAGQGGRKVPRRVASPGRS